MARFLRATCAAAHSVQLLEDKATAKRNRKKGTTDEPADVWATLFEKGKKLPFQVCDGR